MTQLELNLTYDGGFTDSPRDRAIDRLVDALCEAWDWTHKDALPNLRLWANYIVDSLETRDLILAFAEWVEKTGENREGHLFRKLGELLGQEVEIVSD